MVFLRLFLIPRFILGFNSFSREDFQNAVWNFTSLFRPLFYSLSSHLQFDFPIPPSTHSVTSSRCSWSWSTWFSHADSILLWNIFVISCRNISMESATPNCDSDRWKIHTDESIITRASYTASIKIISSIRNEREMSIPYWYRMQLYSKKKRSAFLPVSRKDILKIIGQIFCVSKSPTTLGNLLI